MKKYIIILLIFVTPLIIRAQKYSNVEKAQISSKIDSLLQKYMQKSALSEMPGLKKRNEKMFKEFKNLFTNDASVFDDMNAAFDQQAANDYHDGKSKVYPYKLETKTRNDYFDGLVDDFENGFVINNKNINVNYINFDDGIVKAALERQIEGTSDKGYKLQNNDTLLLTLSIQKDKTIKISKIEKIGSNLKILNDKDLDGVIDTKDDCPAEFGKIALSGCPDKDNDGIPDKDDACPDIPGPASNKGCPPSTFSYQFVFSGSAGYELSNNKLEMPDFNQLGYTSINKAASDQGNITNPKSKGGLAINANFAYYIGKNKQTRNKGISIGLSEIIYKADYGIENAKYVFQGTDINNNKYSRIVTINSGSENATYKILNIPLLLKFKGRFGKAWAYEFSAGASYMIFSTSSSYNYNISFEGIYNATDSYSPTDNLNNSSNLVLEGNTINSKLFGSNAATLYQELREAQGYDFAYQKIYSGNPTVKTRTGLGLDAGADLFYHIRAKLAIKVGLNYIYAPSIKNKASNSYEIMNNSTDNLQSIFNSSVKSTFTSYGLNIGIIIGLY